MARTKSTHYKTSLHQQIIDALQCAKKYAEEQFDLIFKKESAMNFCEVSTDYVPNMMFQSANELLVQRKKYCQAKAHVAYLELVEQRSKLYQRIEYKRNRLHKLSQFQMKRYRAIGAAVRGVFQRIEVQCDLMNALQEEIRQKLVFGALNAQKPIAREQLFKDNSFSSQQKQLLRWLYDQAKVDYTNEHCEPQKSKIEIKQTTINVENVTYKCGNATPYVKISKLYEEYQDKRDMDLIMGELKPFDINRCKKFIRKSKKYC